ncbi:unnamed protein product [Parnassius mnemosyne]|uniref:HAT C-terminal dimerisation domain-containing protein n=1 Tax=Parnassius mnemosyne TaxID=213953 RepID=A0AAV1LYD6_9NEOP
MLPNKLKRHLETTHSNLQGKPRDFFVRKLRELKHQSTALLSKVSVPTKALLASYKVAHRVAKCKKPHTIAEELILPAAVDMKLIDLNKSLQGNNTHILQLADKITGFQKKLLLWKRKLEEDHAHTDCFPAIQCILQENSTESLDPSLLVKLIFTQHLSSLSEQFENYFPENLEQYDWVRNPFQSTAPSTLSTKEEEQLIELYCDSSLKLQYDKDKLLEFWSLVSHEYRAISCAALRVLLPFATSYLCETGFSAVAVIKNKYRSKINIAKEMRVAIFKLEPRFEKLCSEKQAHPSR